MGNKGSLLVFMFTVFIYTVLFMILSLFLCTCVSIAASDVTLFKLTTGVALVLYTFGAAAHLADLEGVIQEYKAKRQSLRDHQLKTTVQEKYN